MIIKNIVKKYGEHKVLKGVNVSLEKKGLVFVVGNSGSGKSTLLHIMGMLDNEYQGQVFIKDTEIHKNRRDNYKIIGNNIDFVFQDFNLINMLSVSENIALANKLIGTNNTNENIDRICDELGILHCKDRKVNKLSGGEKQRTAIARALIRGNQIILADEPTGNLDSENEKNIFEILKKISKEKLVVVITHNIEAANKYGDRIIKISDGEIIEDRDNGYATNDKIVWNEGRNYDKKVVRKSRLELAVKSLISRRKKIIPSCVAMLLCILSVAAVFGMYTNINKVVNGIDNTILENDKKVIESYEIFKGYKIISEEFLAKVRKIKEVDKISEEYSINLGLYDENMEDTYSMDLKYEIVDGTEFYNDRYDMEKGRLPQNDDEVAINEVVDKQYFDGEDSIGKKIKVVDSSAGECVELTVVGVSKNGITTSKGIVVYKGFDQKLHRRAVENNSWVVDFPEYDYNTYWLYVDKSLEEVKKQKNYSLVYGRESENANEIVVDITGINQLLAEMEEDVLYSNEDIAKGCLTAEQLEKIFNATIRYVENFAQIDIEQLKITGICVSDSSFENVYDIESSIPAYISGQLVDNILEKKVVNQVKVYTNSEQALEEIARLCAEYSYDVKNANEEFAQEIGFRLSTIMSMVLVVCVIVLIITIFMLRYSTKINVLDSVYETGVIKSLGVSDAYVFGKYMWENILQGSVVGILAMVIGVILANTKLFVYEGINVMDFEMYYWIVFLVLSILISMVSGMGEIYKISRKQIVDCLKRS